MDFLHLGDNPFFSGGLVLMILGGLLAYARHIPGQIYEFIERFFIVKIDIQDEDESYGWMQIWLAEKLNTALSVSVITKRPTGSEEAEEPSFVDNRPQVYFVPAVGTYFFWYKHRFVTLNRDRRENATGSANLLAGLGEGKGMLRTKESFTIRIFSRNKDLARQLIEECRDKAIPEDGKLDIRVGTYNYWSLGTRIRPRPLNSVILDGDQADFLLKDMKEYLDSYDWYQSVGVPFRRSYLLYGEPGNGKTSVVKALAGAFNMNIYLLMLSDPDMTDNRINDLLAKVADKNILLLEDIDCAFNKRLRSNGKEGGLTFSGLLNAIDGVASPEGRIIFMTTNHIDRLDPALIRPGRADVKLYFGNATQDQAGRLYSRFFPGYLHLAKDFASMIEDRKYSMAVLQNYLQMYKKTPIEAMQRVGEIGQMEVQLIENHHE
jgi:mitochondrial chaperone BCS1